jgi:hypothetical protein
MKRFSLIGLVILCLASGTAHAGPCSVEIANIERAVGQPNSPATPSAPQSIAAEDSHQPTQESVARAKRQARAQYRDVLNKAKALDAANDPNCREVVVKLKNLLEM